MNKFFLITLLSFSVTLSFAQKTSSKKPATNTFSLADDDYSLLTQSLRWRCIGPFRGGRSLAVCGVRGNNQIYYFGAVGGGVWKTINGGTDWSCISDTTFKSSSVGAITVAPSDANIIYVGMGEAEMRNNISFGDGMYKSTDAGKTWKHIGLEKSYAIQNIVVHPKNPDLVYCSAMGKIFGANAERGLYRSKDGGKTWQLILSKNDSTGCVQIVMDPVNPDVLYASLWQARRSAYDLVSGGAGSCLYKSIDGGDHWTSLSQNPGMPVGLLGKIMVAVSPVDNDLLFALVENKNGGLFRSDDAGKSWSKLPDNANLTQRPWYFSQIFCDVKDTRTVYVLNVQAWKSVNGGNSWQGIYNHHGDNHDFWQNPDDADNFMIGDDGGGEVTFDGGAHFTELDFPTAQMYHVNLSNDFPYHVYGDQQDNSSICIASRTRGYSIDASEWFPVAGGESGYIVPDPDNWKITYGGGYDGYLGKYNYENNQNQDISVYPESTIGAGSVSRINRFQWTFPIAISPWNSKIIYVGSQYVYRSMDAGMSWVKISDDLSRHDSTRLQPSGGPINKDNTGAEVYADVYAIAESPVTPGVIWVGSDDGLIHVSKDNGKTWENVTPPASLLPEWAMISIVEPSHFDVATCYASATRYKSDDTKPYLLKTNDYGKTWSIITNGIPVNAYTRCIREDMHYLGLLYAGTETGIYFSLDNGAQWHSLQLNLPITPVMDIQIHPKENDLVIATHGRRFWILDDVSYLYETDLTYNSAIHRKEILKAPSKNIVNEKYYSTNFLFTPRINYRMQGGSYQTDNTGENAPNGVILRYWLKSKPNKELKFIFLKEKSELKNEKMDTIEVFETEDSNSKTTMITKGFSNYNSDKNNNLLFDTIITYSSTKDKKGEPIKISKDFYQEQKIARNGILTADSGLNTFVWDMRFDEPERLEGAVLWNGYTTPKVVPGDYKVKMFIGDSLIQIMQFEIKMDPAVTVETEDLQAQLDYIKAANKKLGEVHKAVKDLRTIRSQVNDFIAGVTDTAVAHQLRDYTKAMLDTLDLIENNFVNLKAKAGQDVLKYPIVLNDKISALAGGANSADAKPSPQFYDALTDLSARADVFLRMMDREKKIYVPAFNSKVKELNVPAIQIK